MCGSPPPTIDKEPRPSSSIITHTDFEDDDDDEEFDEEEGINSKRGRNKPNSGMCTLYWCSFLL